MPGAGHSRRNMGRYTVTGSGGDCKSLGETLSRFNSYPAHQMPTYTNGKYPVLKIERSEMAWGFEPYRWHQIETFALGSCRDGSEPFAEWFRFQRSTYFGPTWRPGSEKYLDIIARQHSLRFPEKGVNPPTVIRADAYAQK